MSCRKTVPRWLSLTVWSTIEQADEIVVVEDGRIVERGTHHDLLEHKGVYAQLHKMQFGE